MQLFYQPPNDNNVYHITCKIILQDYDYDYYDYSDYYDYEFFYMNSNDYTYHVTCKLISYSLIISILNKEIYRMEFDVNDLKTKYSLTSHQKLNLQLNLKEILPYYFCNPEKETRLSYNEIHEKEMMLGYNGIHEKEMRSDYNENANFFHGVIQHSTITDQNC